MLIFNPCRFKDPWLCIMYFQKNYQWIRFGRDFSRGRPRNVRACSWATHSRTIVTTRVNLKIQIDHSYIYFRRKNDYNIHAADICRYTLPLGSLYFLHESQRSRKSLIFHHYAWSLRNYHQELHLFASVKKYSILSIIIDTELSEMD